MYFILIALLCISLSIQSQNAPGSYTFSTATYTSTVDSISFKSMRKNAIAVSFGSPGIGVEFARRITKKLSARVAYHTFSLKDYEVEGISIGTDDVGILGGLETQVWDFGGEFTPFTKSSFKLTFGVGILSNVNLNAKVTYKEDITFGNVTIAAANVGHVLIDSRWSGTAPFLGIGFGRAVPKKRIGLSFEFGTYFATSPKVTLDATKLLAPTKDQETNLQEAFESLKFIPRAQIKLAIKL